jgi:putative phosphoribosyl transferase
MRIATMSPCSPRRAAVRRCGGCAEVARALDAPLDVLLVRRLLVPGRNDRAIGAVVGGGARLIDTRAVRALNLSLDEVEALTGVAARALEREERMYRGDRPPPDVAERTVILVDGAVVSGGRMGRRARRAAAGATRVVVAVPVAPPDACADLRGVADAVVYLCEPERVGAVSAWYWRARTCSRRRPTSCPPATSCSRSLTT